MTREQLADVIVMILLSALNSYTSGLNSYTSGDVLTPV